MSRNVRNWAWPQCKGVPELGYTFQISVDDLDTIAVPAFDINPRSKYIRAVWQDLPDSPRTCPSEGASLCTYKAWVARPNTAHLRTLFRLAMSNRCVEALLRFRLGIHNLPWIVGRMQSVGHRGRAHCAIVNLIALELQALHSV